MFACVCFFCICVCVVACVCVCKGGTLTPMHGEEHHGTDEDGLHVEKFNGMDGGDAEGRGLLVLVVQLVEVFVEEGQVVHTVVPVRQVVLQTEHHSQSS